jgi:hypothetical protein
MTYSSALFEHETDDLSVAQTHKYQSLATAIGLPSLDGLRAELAAEPVICNRPIGHDVPVQPDDQLQFELM